MPLLAKKLFHYVKPLTTVKDDDKIFTIAHTKEQFRSKSEYEKRLRLYKERIWTCRCTGHVNLTHEEAWNSERSVKKQLKAQFPRCYDKPVLALVHHSTRSLDTLVDQSWLMLQQVLCVGEKVVLKVKAGSKLIKAVVLKVDTSGVEANPTSNCSSPSSDKENNEKDENSPKKWIPPKLLPYKYTVRLEDEEKIINSVPASEIGRGEKPPSKELLRLFIRSHALRAGQNPNSPWIVDDELVKKHGLTSKFASFLLSPTKWRPEEIAKKFEEESKKRKSPVKEKSSPSKKPKLDKTKEIKKKDKKEKKSSSKKTKSEENSKSSKEVVNISASDEESLDSDEESVSESGDSDVPLSEMKPTPKKKSSSHKPSTISIVTKSGSLDSDVPLSKLKQLTPKKDSSGSKPSTPSSAKKLKTSKSSENIKKKDGKDKNRVKDKKKSLKKNAPKKGLKQLTLLELSKKKGMKSPEKVGKSDEKLKKTPDKNKKTPEKMFPDKKKAPSTPAVIQMLMKQLKTENKALINFYTMKAAQTLTPAQRAKLPAEIQTRIQKKVEWLEEKRKLAAMSALEKEEYFKKKKELRKEKFREYSRMRAKELNKKCEDTELDLKPLPQPKQVVTPEGLPNETFGDVAMVAEFIACYAGLLMPDEEYPIYTDALMKALTGGKEGFAYLSRVLVILLQTLLQDKISEDYQEINVSLSDIPVNPFTASELVRLCLRKRDASHNNDEEEEEEDEDEEVPEELIQLLETKEMYQLEPVQKLQILKGMCLRIMATYSVQDYMEEKQQEASKLWKEKLAQAKEDKKKNRDDKNLNANNENKVENKTEASATGDGGLSVPHFYGSKLEDKSQPSSDAESAIDVEEGDNNDLASVVKKRRQLAAKVAAEKAKREEERRIQKEKEYEKYRKEKERENFEKKFSEGIALAKSVLRQTPIGTDRNHNRYWIFNSSTTPGLYIEKGWVGDEIVYSVYNENENEKEDKVKSASSSDEESEASESSADPESQEKEKTFPYPGQNLWFTYESVKDLDALVENLHPQGIREKALKNELKKRYQEVSKAILLFQRNNKELRDSDGDKEMLEVFKKELQDTELKLRNGGLGGVPNFQTWDTKLTTATDIKALAGLLLEVQEHVVEKFKQGIMAPKTKRKKPTPTEVKEEQVEDEEEDKEEEEETEEKVVKGIAAWREAVENCTTLSRLHTLLGILDSSIKWEKSAENAKCKICRKKSEDAYLLLCDECNQAFHMFCLRPALVDVPPGDWFCPACAPLSRRRQTVKYGGYMEDSNSEGEDDDANEHDENCHECGGDEGLIFCSECPSAYHLECHDPPLRHPPRGHWLCNDCKNGVTRKTRSGRQVRKTQRRGQSAPSRKRKREYSSDEEGSDEETDEDFDEEEEENPKPPPRKQAKKASSSRDDKKTESSNAKSRSQKSKRPGSVDIYETQPPVQISRRAPSELSICEDILNRMLKHKMAWPFLMAVSKKDVPDYYLIVKQPIDLQKIKDKLNVLVYGSPQEVVDDIALMFRNCAQYNQADSEIFDCMEVLEKFFVELLQKHLPMYYYNRDGAANGYADHMYNQSGNRRTKKSK